MQTQPPEALVSPLGSASRSSTYRAYCQLAAWAARNGWTEDKTADYLATAVPAAYTRSGSLENDQRQQAMRAAEYAFGSYIPGLRSGGFDQGPLHELAARISGSGVTHESYLLGAIALCLRYETLTPVITGPLLAEVTGTSTASAGEVLSKWSSTLAYGFFTEVGYDGIPGHGRVWTVDPGWTPVSRPTHAKGCRRGKRCTCSRAKSQIYLLPADKDRSGKTRQWLDSLQWQQRVTVTDACKALGVTRAQATKLLRSGEGKTFEAQTIDPDNRSARTWLVADRWQRWPEGTPLATDN